MPPRKIAKIVGLVALLAVIVVVLIDRIISSGILPAIFERTESEPSAPDSKPSAKDEKAARPPGKKAFKSSPETATEPVTIRNAPVIPLTPDARQEIKPGMNRSQLIQALGDPTLRTTQTLEAKLVERYIYVDRDRRVITVAVLENGRTVRSEIRPYAHLSVTQAH